MFAKPPPAPKKAPAPVLPPPPAAHQVQQPSIEPVTAENDVPPPIESVNVDDGPSELPSAPHSDTGKDLTPSKDELTEKNLEKLPDTSHPPPSATAASTVASTQDPLAAVETTKPTIRPGMSGFAATALKATGPSGRSASYARKVMEQQEAVVMPGNHAMEKAAVQFGKLGLGGDDVDVDEDREEPETRTQLPDDSPSAPRASLPPSLPEAHSQSAAVAPSQPLAEAQHSQRAAPGLPRLPNRPNNLLPSLRLRMLISTAMAKDRSRMIRSVNKAQRPRHRLSLKNPFPTKSPIRRQPRAHRMIILLTMDVTRTTTMVHMRTKASALAVVL